MTGTTTTATTATPPPSDRAPTPGDVTSAGGVAALAAATPAHRDRVVDLLRAVSIGVVVLWHWSLSVTHWRDGSLRMPNPIGDVPGLWATTWLLQVMPLFFLVGGYANLAGWRSVVRDGLNGAAQRFWARRFTRLARPVAVYVASWLALDLVIRLGGGPSVVSWGMVVLVPLWFLGVYAGVVALVPWTARLHASHRLGALAGFVGVAALVDVARLGLGVGVPGLGVLSSAAVWLFCHQLGYVWHDLVAGFPSRPARAMALRRGRRGHQELQRLCPDLSEATADTNGPEPVEADPSPGGPASDGPGPGRSGQSRESRRGGLQRSHRPAAGEVYPAPDRVRPPAGPVRLGAGLIGVGLTALVVLTGVGPYPRSMVAVRREDVSNMFPTTVCIATLAVLQLGVVLVLRARLARWVARRRVWQSVIAANAVAMTVFCWHMTALVGFLLTYEAVGFTLADQPTAMWWWTRPVWVVGPALLLSVLVAAFARFELPRRALPRRAAAP